MLTRAIFIRPDSELIRESVCACAKLFVDEENVLKSNRKLCVKIKKRCYTDRLHFSTRIW
jgi:hypothetical protein